MRIERHDLDGQGPKRRHVYDMTPVQTAPISSPGETRLDYWAAVTNVPCPGCGTGLLRWAEANYVPGYRICDGCGRHFLASGTAKAPVVIRFASRRSPRRTRDGVRPSVRMS